jgi:putative DNA primase/helicase
MDNLKFSLFENKTATKPREVTSTWARFCEQFKKPTVRTSKDGLLFAPAIFDPPQRLAENVKELWLLVFDFDRHADFDTIKTKIESLNVNFVIHSTFSHLRKTDKNPDAEPRFRACIPFCSPVPAEDFPAVWNHVKNITGLPIDESAKDVSRMFYTPAIIEKDAAWKFHAGEGEFLDWRTLPLDSQKINDKPKNKTNSNYQSNSFEFHEDRHAELCRRVEKRAKSTGRGTFEMKCPAHNGNGNSSLFYDPNTEVVACIKKPNNCSYFEILAAFGLPSGHLPSREHREKANPIAPNEFTGEPRPLDLTLKPVAALDDDCLPKVLTDWLRPASKVIGCPFDFLVLSAVVMIGSVIGSRLRVKPLRHSDWFVVPNLYGGCVGLPSTKKTPALDETRKPILELQAKARKEFSDKIKDFVIEAKCYERDTAAVYKEKLGLTDTKTKINELTEPNTPVLKRYETNDITTPKLAQFLSENPIGLLQNRDELVGWFKSLEADYDLNARSFILEVWKGAIAYELARVGNGEIQITSGTLSIIGGIQPSKLQRYISEAYSFDNSDGLPQRFLFAYPDTSRRSEKPTGADYDQMLNGYAAANRICKTLAEFDFSGRVIGANGDVFQIVKFNAEAQGVVDEWNNDIESAAESLQIEDEAFSAYLYKLPKSCFAIALIFHCLEHINDAVFPNEITLETTLRAIAYTEVLTTHARRVFALGENQIFSLAQILIGKIKKGELEQGFTAYEIKRKQWSGLKTPDTIKDVIGLLLDYGYLLELPTSGEGRPTIKYAFHPSLETEKKDEME